MLPIAKLITRKALLIAINYAYIPEEAEDRYETLQGYHQLKDIKQLLLDQYQYREEDIVVMMDLNGNTGDPLWPTKENILREVRILVEGASYLDRRFLYFTGHGANSVCDHQSEVDMLDEAIVDGCGVKVIDNDLHDALCGRLSVGPEVIALFDCCHSATILGMMAFSILRLIILTSGKIYHM